MAGVTLEVVVLGREKEVERVVGGGQVLVEKDGCMWGVGRCTVRSRCVVVSVAGFLVRTRFEGHCC